MELFNEKHKSIMNERFSKDCLISLATSVDNLPYVRIVDAVFSEDSFYIITYNLSNKMNQIRINDNVAIAGEWFTGFGKVINLGWFNNIENKQIADKLKEAFSSWIDNGHNNFSDKNTIILRIKLSNGVLFSNGTKYQFEF